MRQSHACNYDDVAIEAETPRGGRHRRSISGPRQEVLMADQRGDANRFDATGIDLNENWQDDANCLGVDPDLFFPERGASTREAKEVCRGCVVREECLEFALANGEKFGIWGGMSERERRRVRRARALARRAAGGSASA